MSESKEVRGPVMLSATPVLKPGRTRIAKLSKGITLPRTVEVVSLIAALVGAFLGLVLTLVFTRSWQSLLFGTLVGATLGWISTTWSPLQNESLAKWLGLKVSRSRNTVARYGKSVVVYVGVSPLSRIAEGKTILRPGATDVFPGSVDADGRPLEEETVAARFSARTKFSSTKGDQS